MNHLKNNRGNTVVEATLILPIFLFAMLALYGFCQCKIAENLIFEAASETAEYLAEYAYIGDGNGLIAEHKFKNYLDNEALVEKYVKGGVSGVSFFGSVYLDEKDKVTLNVSYTLSVRVPFFGAFAGKKNYTITQKAYIGYKNGTDEDLCGDETYVYVTDNRDVYHLSRSCTHLSLSVSGVSRTVADKNGLRPCSFCGQECGNFVYITSTGNAYHSDKTCSGLKRTVYKVSLREVGTLPPCIRCGGR
ncbi:MAG: pilus assembly protein [Clostridium sp.]|nr:pilus assembly protein [Clostridium sp.]MCM1398629.1 pilus assembly protein [Clostridium sp.]MCM1459915.1 pilus assembly protein [Bacteroides sp.]